ncbi:MAG: hypothetical protein GY866_04285 [Proteobacteria bacterium]|nr:hypothetical protein [Pseudomonadota bacterium]
MNEQLDENFPILDLEFLETRKVIADTFLSKLIETFYAEVPKLVSKIKFHQQNAEEERIRELGHKLKGMCLNMGAMYLSEIARKIEEEGREKLPVLIREIDAAFDKTRRELDKLGDNH